jgi:hypothetical protein
LELYDLEKLEMVDKIFKACNTKLGIVISEADLKAYLQEKQLLQERGISEQVLQRIREENSINSFYNNLAADFNKNNCFDVEALKEFLLDENTGISNKNIDLHQKRIVEIFTKAQTYLDFAETLLNALIEVKNQLYTVAEKRGLVDFIGDFKEQLGNSKLEREIDIFFTTGRDHLNLIPNGEDRNTLLQNQEYREIPKPETSSRVVSALNPKAKPFYTITIISTL